VSKVTRKFRLEPDELPLDVAGVVNAFPAPKDVTRAVAKWRRKLRTKEPVIARLLGARL